MLFFWPATSMYAGTCSPSTVMVPLTGFWPWQEKHSSLPLGLSGAPVSPVGSEATATPQSSGEAGDQQDTGERRRPEKATDTERCLSGAPLDSPPTAAIHGVTPFCSWHASHMPFG